MCGGSVQTRFFGFPEPPTPLPVSVLQLQWTTVPMISNPVLPFWGVGKVGGAATMGDSVPSRDEFRDEEVGGKRW